MSFNGRPPEYDRSHFGILAILVLIRHLLSQKRDVGVCSRCDGSSDRSLMVDRKEGNVLFNDALNTFYFTVMWRRTYGKGPFR